MISTPGGKIASNQLNRMVPLKLSSKIISTDLIMLPLEGMDVILGMEWMNKHGVLLDISSRAVEIDSPTHGHSVLYLPHSEHVNSCAYAMKDIRLEDIPVVCEYADVFRMIYWVCHRTGILNLSLNYNPVPHLSRKGRTKCHLKSWRS